MKLILNWLKLLQNFRMEYMKVYTLRLLCVSQWGTFQLLPSLEFSWLMKFQLRKSYPLVVKKKNAALYSLVAIDFPRPRTVCCDWIISFGKLAPKSAKFSHIFNFATIVFGEISVMESASQSQSYTRYFVTNFINDQSCQLLLWWLTVRT